MRYTLAVHIGANERTTQQYQCITGDTRQEEAPLIRKATPTCGK